MQRPNNPMTEEQLSQLMDGEWHELNPSECVAGICNDEALQAKWSRYHLIRDAMKNEPVSDDQGLAHRIFDAIDNEPTYSNIKQFMPPGVEGDADRPNATAASVEKKPRDTNTKRFRVKAN